MIRITSSHRFILVLIGVVLLSALEILSACASADNSAPRPHCSVPQIESAPALTADPGDPAWANAAVIPALTECVTGNSYDQMPHKTSVQLLWSPDYLYLRFNCDGDQPYSPFKHHDDDVYKGDACEVFLDAKGDSRAWIEIQVSPYNVTFDQLTTLTADPVSDNNLILSGNILSRDYWPNLSWNMDGLKTATQIIKKDGKTVGWVEDLAIPAKAALQRLGLAAYAPMTLRANFLRVEWPYKTGTKTREFIPTDWAPVLLGCPHISPQAMGYLDLQSREGPG